MAYVFQITDCEVLPPHRDLVEAATRGVSNVVIEHLTARNDTAKHREGFPRSNYWSEAADAVTTEMDGTVGVVSIPKEGVAIHFYGGVIYPGNGKKALAIPVNPAVAGMRAAEYDPNKDKLDFAPSQDGKAPTLRDPETDAVFYVLLSSTRIKADPTVLPTDDAMFEGASDAMEAVLC